MYPWMIVYNPILHVTLLSKSSDNILDMEVKLLYIVWASLQVMYKGILTSI
jgi:hypothetical protein